MRSSIGYGPVLALFAALAACSDSTSSPTGMAPVKDGTLHYESRGAGSAIVLIHGTGFDSRVWDDQIAVLAGEHRVIRYDRRGFGQSPPARSGYSEVEDLSALLSVLHVDRAALVGIERGAAIALDFALEHADMVSALVLIAPGVSGSQPSRPFSDRLSAIAQAAPLDGGTRAAQLWIDDPLFVQLRKQAALEQKLLAIASTNAGSWTARPPDPGPLAIDRLDQLRVPTLVVIGGLDIPDFQRLADKVAREVPNAHKLLIREADHALNVEHAEQFNRIVLRFLATAGAPRG